MPCCVTQNKRSQDQKRFRLPNVSIHTISPNVSEVGLSCHVERTTPVLFFPWRRLTERMAWVSNWNLMMFSLRLCGPWARERWQFRVVHLGSIL